MASLIAIDPKDRPKYAATILGLLEADARILLVTVRLCVYGGVGVGVGGCYQSPLLSTLPEVFPRPIPPPHVSPSAPSLHPAPLAPDAL